MAANQLVQARIDGEIKEQSAVMGLTISDAVRLLLVKMAQDRALPFQPLIPKATTIQAMKGVSVGRVKKTGDLDTLFRELNGDA
ncbi:MAG: type II toxin-antitoxin system RelB/DinJ family antitoxin [Candidatus Methylacidiphilaceae bacterium]